MKLGCTRTHSRLKILTVVLEEKQLQRSKIQFTDIHIPERVASVVQTGAALHCRVNIGYCRRLIQALSEDQAGSRAAAGGRRGGPHTGVTQATLS